MKGEKLLSKLVERITLQSDNEKEMFTATKVLTAYVDEYGNVTYVESSWDDLFKKEEKDA